MHALYHRSGGQRADALAQVTDWKNGRPYFAISSPVSRAASGNLRVDLRLLGLLKRVDDSCLDGTANNDPEPPSLRHQGRILIDAHRLATGVYVI